MLLGAVALAVGGLVRPSTWSPSGCRAACPPAPPWHAGAGRLGPRRLAPAARAQRRAARAGAGTSVLVIGAGEAGRELIGSMLRDPQRTWHPVGLLDDDPYKRHRRLRGVPVLGTTDELADAVEATGAETVIIAIPSADAARIARLRLAGDRGRRRRQGAPVDHAAAHRPRRHPRHPRRQPDRRAGPQPARHRRRGDRRLPHRRAGAGHRRRWLDRLRAVPADPPVRAGRADDARPRRVGAARRPALDPRAGPARLRRRRSCATSATAPPCTRLRRAPARGGLPRRGAQAPADARAVPGRGRQDQRHRHPAPCSTPPTRSACDRFVNISTDKAANPCSVLGYSKRIAERLTAARAARLGRHLSSRCGSATCWAAAARC